jgi:putative membrane protein
MTQRLPMLLLSVYLVLFTLLARDPYDRTVWLAENLPIVLIVAALVLTRRWFAFSSTAYLMMMALIVLHTIGGHFTFERVPFDWVTEFFGFSRNHYDRMAHFTVGFYAYPLAELLLRKRWVASRFVLFTFPVCFILAVAGIYEIFEWRYAVSADPSAGAAVLGSQGDVWDAQKDMLADGLGSLVAMILFFGLARKEIRRIQPPPGSTPAD